MQVDIPLNKETETETETSEKVQKKFDRKLRSEEKVNKIN